MEEKKFNVTEVVTPTEAIIEYKEVTANEMKQIMKETEEEKEEEDQRKPKITQKTQWVK